jgi:hypothetical protein
MLELEDTFGVSVAATVFKDGTATIDTGRPDQPAGGAVVLLTSDQRKELIKYLTFGEES